METLCHAIELPQEVIDQILTIHADPDFSPDAGALCRPQDWDLGLRQLEQALAPDPRGMKMLCTQLRCAVEAQKVYKKLGISREIYVDTMKAFPRFIREHMDSYGFYAFDRAFWTVRQISCKLFRIGELEYELIDAPKSPVIGLHIPSDAKLEPPLLRSSYEQARALIASVFPRFGEAPIQVESWLLSPDLEQLLPEKSRIRRFQQSFLPMGTVENSQNVRQWVFLNPSLPLEQVPQHTSLQRSLKAFLEAGNPFREGIAQLKEDPFLD